METNLDQDLFSDFSKIYAIRSHLISEQVKINKYIIDEFSKYAELFINSHVPKSGEKVSEIILVKSVFEKYTSNLFDSIVDDCIPEYLDELSGLLDDLYDNVVDMNRVNSKLLRSIDVLGMNSLLVADGYIDKNIVEGLENHSADNTDFESFKSDMLEFQDLLKGYITDIGTLGDNIDGMSIVDDDVIDNVKEPLSLFAKSLSGVCLSDSDSVTVLNAGLLEKNYEGIKNVMGSWIKGDYSRTFDKISDATTINDLIKNLQNISLKKSYIMDEAYGNLGYNIKDMGNLFGIKKVQVFRSID